MNSRFLAHRQFLNDPLRFLLNAYSTQGDVAQLNVRSTKTFLVSHPDLVKQVLVTNANDYTKKTTAFEQLRLALGNGILTSDGEYWLKQRRTIQGAFSKPNLERYAGDIHAIAESWVNTIQPNKPIEIASASRLLALRMVSQSLFQQDLSQYSEEIDRELTFAVRELIARAWSPRTVSLILRMTNGLRLGHSIDRLQTITKSVIEFSKSGAVDSNNIVNELDKVNSEPTALQDEVITLLLAGHETTASALTFTLFMLSRNPGIRRKVVDEINANSREEVPSVGTLASLRYTRQVVDEVLRIYPPVWFFERRSELDQRVGNVAIPAGSEVVISPYVTHRHSEFWRDPEGFDPGRFDDGEIYHNQAYLPFGGGKRLCVGRDFALMEVLMVLTSLCRKYRLELVPGQKLSLEPVITLRPRYGIVMISHRL